MKTGAVEKFFGERKENYHSERGDNVIKIPKEYLVTSLSLSQFTQIWDTSGFFINFNFKDI